MASERRVATVTCPAGHIAVAIPSRLIADYRKARARVARGALPAACWTGDEASRLLRDAIFALSEAASKEQTP